VISAYDFLLANMHALDFSSDVEADPNEESVDPPPEDEHSDTRLINAAKSKGMDIPPGDICCVMSKVSTRHVNLDQTQYHIPSMILSPLRICHLLSEVQMAVLQEKTCVLSSLLAALLVLKALIIITSKILVSVQLVVLLTPKRALFLPLCTSTPC
jgi:hypothetical protein